MKRMRKTTSIILTVIMVFCLSVTAFAEDIHGSITIKDSKTVSVANKTFAAYKVLDAEFVSGTDASKGVVYKVPEEMKTFFAERYSLDKEEASFDQEVAERIALESDMEVFSKEVLAAAKEAGISPVKATADSEDSSVVIGNLPLGYYVIEDTGAATPISALILDTTTQDAVITIKADRPVIDKKILGEKDTDPATDGEVDANSASIGDKVPYELKTKVPDMTGYEKYFFVVTDNLSKGLTFNKDVKITVGEQELVEDEDFTVSVSEVPEGGTAVKIVFNDFYKNYRERTGEDIVITYSAAVNKDAVIGTQGNPNEVVLEYSNNPNITPEGENEPTENDKEKVIGKTPEEVTKTFVTGIQIEKTDAQRNRLQGAKFKITGERLNQVLVKTDKYEENQEGTYYKLKDGSYTETEPEDETSDQYDSTSTKYKLTTETKVVEDAQHVECEGTVGADGILRFEGLGAGTYEITEIKAPKGYNILKAPIEVVITCELPSTGEGECSWSASEPAVFENGIATVVVENHTGTELPSTGGMGTTIFYVAGGILVAVAAVLLIVRKRMSVK